MLYLQELKIALILLGIILVYKLLLAPQLRKLKTEVLENYIQIQYSSVRLQDALMNYALKHDAMRLELVPGIQIRQYLRHLQKEHALHLSEKQYKKLKKQNVVLFYLPIKRMLKQQEIRLEKVKADLLRLERLPHKVAVGI